MQYGSTVAYVIGNQTVKALVLHSTSVGDDEQLVLAYLDPKHSNSEILSGTQMQEAIRFAFGVVPIKEGLVNGWEPVARELHEPGFFVKFQDLLDLSNAVIANGGSDLEVCPDAVPSSATTVIHRLAEKVVAALAENGKQAEEIERFRQLLIGTGERAALPGGDVVHETKHYAADEGAQAPASGLSAEDVERLKQLSGSGGLAGKTEETPEVASVPEVLPLQPPAPVDEAEFHADPPPTTPEG